MIPTIEMAAEALRSEDSQRQREGVAMIEKLHREGNPTAAYAIGTWHLHGTHGYALSTEKAAPYLQYATEHSIPEAAYDLGVLVETERLGTRARRDAFGHYVLAAILGDQEGAEEVARCFYWGIGTFRNREAAEHIRRVLDRGEQQPLAAE
jgi:TPR repeat protein